MIKFRMLLSACLIGLVTFGHLNASELNINPTPIAIIENPGPDYSLINSVDHHPSKKIFCVTYTHNDKIGIYSNEEGNIQLLQMLNNPSAALSTPQHAAFSPNGDKIIVANWINQTINFYQADNSGNFSPSPISIIQHPLELSILHKPHGVACSPCDKFLAIAYGASSLHARAVALFEMDLDGNQCHLLSLLNSPQDLPGIPKGITFSPDGTCLLVTFADVNSLLIYEIDREHKRILSAPKQIIQGEVTAIFRPEDVKISPNGKWCAISNSNMHTVTFYDYDSKKNCIVNDAPIFILQNPDSQLCFPHGIAFSPDGAFIFITEFGPIITTDEGRILWHSDMQAEKSNTKIYRINPI